MGACASKFSSGSIFPFVEMLLRNVDRVTLAIRTGTSVRRRETKAAKITTAATTPTAISNPRLLEFAPLTIPSMIQPV
jgi:hypothetical protein